MPRSGLILCERTGRWAVAFRRALGVRRTAVTETRSLAACTARLSEQPASVVAVEVTAANLERVLAAVPAWQRRHPQCRFVALVAEELAAAEDLLREAGAVDVLHRAREVPQAARLVVRHMDAAPADGVPLEQAIASKLPWSKGA
jgi:hypothetical protein